MTQPNEMEKLLLNVADEIAIEIGGELDSGENTAAMDVLKRRLLPLLEAGQAMHDATDFENCGMAPSVIQWQEAKRAALEGK